MGNLILSFLIALFAFQGFNISFRSSSFRKTIIQTPKNLFDTSLSLVDESGIKSPCFDKPILENKLDMYFQENLKNVVYSYEAKLLYYNASDQSICKNNCCDGVKVEVTGYVFLNMKITQKMFYEVQKNIK